MLTKRLLRKRRNYVTSTFLAKRHVQADFFILQLLILL
jgi:hypothetical protein